MAHVTENGQSLKMTGTWEMHIGRWATALRAAGQPDTTIGLRTYHLRRCARELGMPVDLISTEDLQNWLSRPNWAASTKRSYRASLRVFYTWAIAAGVVTTSPAHQLAPVRVPRGLPRPAADRAYVAALAAADDRVRRALRLGAECGLRRGEIARVRAEDVEPDLVGWSLRVIGKGGHVRMVPIADDLASEVRRSGPGWIFPSTARPSHITPAHLGKLISRTLPDGVATHALRHRAGTKAYQGTHDLRAVQEFLGHAKPETTAIYTEIGRDAIRAAMHAAAA